MPTPVLVRPPVPDNVPENVVLVPRPPTVSVAEPSATVPAPANDPSAWSKSLRLITPPAATVVALTALKVFAAPPFSIPPPTAVAPP